MRTLCTVLVVVTLAACGKGEDAIRGGEVEFETFAILSGVAPGVGDVRVSPNGAHVAVSMGDVFLSSAGGEWVQSTSVSPGVFAVTDDGVVFAADAEGFSRTSADGTTDAVGPSLAVESVVAGADGSVWAAGRTLSNQGYEVWRSADGGDSWSLTPMAAGRVTRVGQISGVLYVDSAGTAFSVRGGEGVQQSSDLGDTWTDVDPPAVAHVWDRFGIPGVNNRGQFFLPGPTAILIYDANQESYLSVPRDSIPITLQQGSLAANGVIASDGALYWAANILAATPESEWLGGDILKYEDGTWSHHARVPAARQYSGTRMDLSSDGLVVGTGHAGVATVGLDGSVTTSAPAETLVPPTVSGIAPLADDSVLVASASGPLLHVDAQGVTTALDVYTADVFESSNGTLIAYDSGFLRISMDGGQTFVPPAAATPPDPLNLGNVMSSTVRRSVQVNQEVFLSIATERSGVSGPYGEQHFLRLDLDGTLLQTYESRESPDPGATVPQVSGLEGTVGYYFNPRSNNSVDQISAEEYFYTINGEDVEFEGPMPVAGSHGGTFVALPEAGVFAFTSVGNEDDFETVVATYTGAEPTVLPELQAGISGLAPPWFEETGPLITWPNVRFDADERLWFESDGTVYRTTGSF